jgi:hypothetical protein
MIHYKLLCQIIATFYQIYSLFVLIFYLCSFVNPNFAILVSMGFLPDHTSSQGRLMYVVAQVCFWAIYLWIATIAHLGINWKKSELILPFYFWSAVHIIWEVILICCLIAFYQTALTILMIFWKFINIIIATGSVIVFYCYFKSVDIQN